jgi:hypothetical protein
MRRAGGSRRTALLFALSAVILSGRTARAQNLIPGAYTPAPVAFNIVTLVGTLNKGDILFDPSLPIEEGHATIGIAAIGFTRTLSIAKRSASVGLIVPYAHGHIRGLLLGHFEERTRSGPSDMAARVSVNVYGAPAMTLSEFATYRPKTIVGVSLSVGAPVGQYDSTRFINIGANRWTVAPEIGISRTHGPWMFEGDLGGVLFTDNTNFVNGGIRKQSPIAAAQGHVMYTIRRGLWVAADANFWHGGRTTTNGVAATLPQHNSRIGATLAVPFGVHQLRFSYSFGAYTRTGGDFHSLGVSYSYAWIKRTTSPARRGAAHDIW